MRADKLGGYEANKSNWQVIRVGFMGLFMYYLLKAFHPYTCLHASVDGAARHPTYSRRSLSAVLSGTGGVEEETQSALSQLILSGTIERPIYLSNEFIEKL